MYAYYFEHSCTIACSESHHHDWEHAVVFSRHGKAKFVAVTREGDYGVHPKLVYYQRGYGWHTLRFAESGERIENGSGGWFSAPLVSWMAYTAYADRLEHNDWGMAKLDLTDCRIRDALTRAVGNSKDIKFDTSESVWPERRKGGRIDESIWKRKKGVPSAIARDIILKFES
jgi:hypothetical protein